MPGLTEVWALSPGSSQFNVRFWHKADVINTLQMSLISTRSGMTLRLDAVWCEGHLHQKAVVMLGDFFSQGVTQLNLFDENGPRANSEALMSVMDKLNQQGWGTLYFAGQGIQQAWQMKREMLSPYYTTRLADVAAVRVC